MELGGEPILSGSCLGLFLKARYRVVVSAISGLSVALPKRNFLLSFKVQGVVEEFVDQHFVEFNLQKAQLYVVGLALQKINEEIRLTAGHKIDASTQKPKINYRLLEKKEGKNRASYLYEGTVNSDDGHSFTRKWLIAARKEGAQWRVSNFTESDQQASEKSRLRLWKELFVLRIG